MSHAHVNCDDDSTHTRNVTLLYALYISHTARAGGFPNVRRARHIINFYARARQRRIYYTRRDDGFTTSLPTPRTRRFRLGFSLKSHGYIIIILCS